MRRQRILFSGYAPVHFLCFLPVYQRLRHDPDLELFLSGGFKQETADGETTYSLDGFYDPFPVDRERILSVDETDQQDFDVLVCSHTSDRLFPRSVRRSVQIFHGVSFKNLAVREKALAFDVLCLPGRYHADQYRSQGLLRDCGTDYLVTGFAKSDALVDDRFERDAYFRSMELNPDRPTVLFAPTGDKHNALDSMGIDVITAIAESGDWNLIIKPHDHPKKAVNWFHKLAAFESNRVRILRDKNILPSLRAADLLLTDASSVAVEYTLLDRPILFMDVPRLFEKLSERAPALDLDTYGRKIGTVVKQPADLPSAIGEALAHPDAQGDLRRKMARHVFHDPGRASQRTAGVIRHAAGLSPLPDGLEVLQPSA